MNIDAILFANDPKEYGPWQRMLVEKETFYLLNGHNSDHPNPGLISPVWFTEPGLIGWLLESESLRVNPIILIGDIQFAVSLLLCDNTITHLIFKQSQYLDRLDPIVQMVIESQEDKGWSIKEIKHFTHKPIHNCFDSNGIKDLQS